MNTRDTAGTGSGIVRCVKVHYRTRTRSTRFGNTAGIPVPVRNPIHEYMYIWSHGGVRLNLQNTP